MPTELPAFRPTLKKRRILLIRNEPESRDILTGFLEGAYEIAAAASGREALQTLETQYAILSLILLDLDLPDGGGPDVLRRIKADRRFARLPVIVMTADSAAELECLTLGAIDIIPKPYPRQEVVLARILRIIELSEDRDILRWTERDLLTGLYNKEFFFRYAAQTDAYHRDSATDAIVLDINHFHTINDRYGKGYGDEMLKRLAGMLLELARTRGGIAGRSSADTFLIYCPHCRDHEAILEGLARGLDGTGNGDGRIRLRMGVYENTDKSLDIERRFDRAKLAADTVKGSFRHPVGRYDRSMHEAELLSEQLIEDFPAALRERQFVVHYQPKFSVRADMPALNSAEALVRWQHPKLGLVQPGDFIPLFEENGMIQLLDRYVWQEAAGQIRDWKERLGVSLPVSVNVSRVDLYDPLLTDRLESIVEENGLSHSDLLLEITESAYSQDTRQIAEKIRQLRKLGFCIEMDDFGAGYSSLGMFSSLPIDALKLDKQFIRDAFRERKDTRLLEAMLRLADSFEIPTIAEGVENAEQAFTLKALGCDIIQGYFYSRPLPPAEFEKLLTDRRNRPVAARGKHGHTRFDAFTYMAMHDPVTGLYNATAFEMLFQDADRSHIGILLAHVDGFGELRQERGPEYADRAARLVAEVLRRNFRSVDHVCRLREEEFVVIMTRMNSAGKSLVFAKLEEVARQLEEGRDGLEPIRLSVGIAFSDRDKPEGDVFQDAETALERLKQAQGTGCAFY